MFQYFGLKVEDLKKGQIYTAEYKSDMANRKGMGLSDRSLLKRQYWQN